MNMHENIKQKRGRWESFDDIDTLGHNCNRLLEDKDGNIWIGTWSGLSRYDGKKFVNFTQKDGLPSNSIVCLHQDREGNIWVGTWGNGVSCYNGKSFVNFSTQDGLAGNFVGCICQDKAENIWLGTGGWTLPGTGLSRYDGKKFVNFTEKHGLASDNVFHVHQDRAGNIWVGTRGGLSRYDGKSFVNFTTKHGLASDDVFVIHQDRDGNIWLGTSNGLSRYDGKSFVNFTTKHGLASNDLRCIYQDKEGSIWIGSDGGGVSCYDGAEFVNFNTEDGLARNVVLDLIQDREGNLWFACYQGGISRYNPYEISYISDESVDEVMIRDRNGGLWWGSGSILSQFDGKDLNHYPFENAIFELFEDSQGRLWIGTNGGGIFRCDNIKDKDLTRIGQGKPYPYIIRNLTVDDGLADNRIWRIREDIAGNIWIGTHHGVSRYDGMKFINYTSDDGLGRSSVSVIYQDRSGMLWFGGWAGSGITSYDGKSFHKYTTKDGLADGRIVCMMEDDKPNLWIGTLSGISYYDRRQRAFRNYTTEDGLLSNAIQRIFQDSRGQIWIATLGGGISRFDGKNFQVLTTDNGLPSNSVTGIIEDREQGSFIISTYKGLCRYTPDYKTPPLIKIDEADTDRIYQEPKEIQISENVKSIRLKYRGLSFKTKRMRYNYILEGYDKEWKATWDEEVRYENLPIGEYTFKVVAINRDLVYSDKAAAIKLTVQPDPRDIEIVALRREINGLRKEVGRKYHFDNIVGRSALIKQVYALMEKAIDSGLTVLIGGETGTGKELVAKAIHYSSSRKDKPLLFLNCGSVPKDLVASTLFGHRKGAFTGAIEDAVGLFETAAGGTVILDEISEMPKDAQVHLLRVLQERKIQRLGETRLRDVDVRVIAITNRDLQAEVKAGQFREDLYYRLNVFPIPLPTLKDRLDDTPFLAEHFLQKASHQLGKEIAGLADGVIDMLSSYSWPGNIRELENEIYRAAAFVEEGQKIQRYHFSSNITKEESLIQEVLSESLGYSESLERFRRRLIQNALQECDGNRTQAAKKLGMDRSSLVAIIKRLGIEK